MPASVTGLPPQAASSSPPGIPSFLELEITGLCQLRCVHCYAESGPHGGRGTMTLADWEKVIDQAAAIGVKMVQFIGGEPTLDPDLPRLIGYALGNGLKVYVYSNLVHVTPELWELFSQPGVFLGTSWYSADPGDARRDYRQPGQLRAHPRQHRGSHPARYPGPRRDRGSHHRPGHRASSMPSCAALASPTSVSGPPRASAGPRMTAPGRTWPSCAATAAWTARRCCPTGSLSPARSAAGWTAATSGTLRWPACCPARRGGIRWPSCPAMLTCAPAAPDNCPPSSDGNDCPPASCR